MKKSSHFIGHFSRIQWFSRLTKISYWIDNSFRKIDRIDFSDPIQPIRWNCADPWSQVVTHNLKKFYAAKKTGKVLMKQESASTKFPTGYYKNPAWVRWSFKLSPHWCLENEKLLNIFFFWKNNLLKISKADKYSR